MDGLEDICAFGVWEKVSVARPATAVMMVMMVFMLASIRIISSAVAAHMHGVRFVRMPNTIRQVWKWMWWMPFSERLDALGVTTRATEKVRAMSVSTI